MQFNRKHLITLEELDAEEISLILDTADSFKEVLHGLAFDIKFLG